MTAAASNVIAFPPGKSGPPSEPEPAPTPAGLLRECRVRSVKALTESVSKALDTFVDELYELAENSLDRETRDFYLKAKEEWPNLRPRLEQRFRERLEETFDRKGKGETDETPDFSRVQTSWSDLSLVADGDLDESVRFTDIAGRIRNGADEELAALDQRMALVLERPGMESHDNPLSPMAICDAFRSALGVVEQGANLKKLLIRYFDQGVRFPVPKLYAELNTFLKERGVLPTIRYGRSKKPVSGAGPVGAAKAEAGPTQQSVTIPLTGGAAGAGGATMTVTMPVGGSGFGMPGTAAGTAGAGGLAGGEAQDPFAMLQQLMMGMVARPVVARPGSTPGSAMPGSSRVGGFSGLPAGGHTGHGVPPIAGVGMAGAGPVSRGTASTGAAEQAVAGTGNGMQGFPSLDAMDLLNGSGIAGGQGGGGGGGGFQGGGLIGSLTRLQQGDFTAMAEDVPAAFAGAEFGMAAAPDGNAVPAGTGVIGGIGGIGPAPARNVLHALKGTSFAGQMGQMDTVTLDIVAMLFDQIFGDVRIPAAMKGLIGRLQIPMLKVAVMDKSFFSRKTHPARHMLDTLGELSLGLGEGFDAGSALYVRIESVLQKVVDDFADDVAIFDAVTGELESLIQDADKTAEQAAKKESRRIQDKERLEVARLFAQNEVKARISERPLPKAVVRFLATEWMKLLILAYAKGGRESRAWQSLVETMEILVWSLSAKQTKEERQRLVSVLPGLLKRLATGMDIIATNQPTRERFNAVLMRCHAKAIGGGDAATADVETPLSAEHAAARRAQSLSDAFAGVTQGAAVTDAAPESGTMGVEEVAVELPVAETIELSEPQSDVPVAMQMQEEMRPIAAPQVLPAVTVRNPFGAGNIELEEVSFGDLPGFAAAGGTTTLALPSDPDAEIDLPQGDEWTELVQQFKEGDWIELHEEGGLSVQARLSYVSPYRGTYVFTNRKGQKIGEFSMFDITSALRTGRMTVMVNVPLFDRAFSGLVGMLRKNQEEALA